MAIDGLITAPELAAAATAEHGQTALLVERDDASSDVIARIVDSAGYTVLRAADYRDALQALDSALPIDLMLTEVQTAPGTPHGFALGRMARLRRLGLKVVYLADARALPEHEVQGALGPILRKPVEPAVLLSVLDAA